MMRQAWLSCSLFDGVDADELENLLHLLQVRRQVYGKGQVIAESGGTAPYTAVVCSGVVGAAKVNYLGREVAVAHLRAGQVFLLPESISGAPLCFSYVAQERCEVQYLDVSRLYAQMPQTAGGMRIIRNIGADLADLCSKMSLKVSILTLKTLEEKILQLLLSFGEQTACGEVILPMNRRQMAEYLSADRSALCYALMKMKQKGLIDYRRNRFRLLFREKSGQRRI